MDCDSGGSSRVNEGWWVIDLLQTIFVLLVFPAGLAWTARKHAHVKNTFMAVAAIIVSAALPAFLVFYETQQADSITRAASIVVTPFLFILMLIPASVGYALARPKEPQ
jgi:glucan phosphoethanolaminetransferase (alkaline phosphatase superfamily)